jgi:hypothetical protein
VKESQVGGRMTRFDLLREPTPDAFRRLLSILSEESYSFSLVIQPDLGLTASANALLVSLRPHLLRIDRTSSWPGTELLDGVAEVRHYRVESEAVEALLRASPLLYRWRQPRLPEDLALYDMNGRVMLGSTAHERDGWIEVPEALEEVVKSIVGLALHERPRPRQGGAP